MCLRAKAIVSEGAEDALQARHASVKLPGQRKGEGMKTKDQVQVLVVDDEPDIVEIIAFSFKHAGYSQVFTASSGNQAVSLSRQHAFDIVVTDVRMPDGDGLFLLSELKKNKEHTPLVVFLTAFADLSLEEAQNLGALGLLSKPFDLNKVVSLCTEEFEKRQRSG
jgi:CheY-like chemotaxis protein